MTENGNLNSNRFSRIDKNLISSLVKGELYFSSPKSLNDPFDCKLDLRKSVCLAREKAESAQRKVLEYYTEKMLVDIESKVADIGVCCFALNADNGLMWAHYGDMHRGVCLTYDIPSSYVLNNSNHLLGWGEVIYNNNGILDFFLNLGVDDNKDEFDEFIEPLLTKCMTVKSENWRYEEEFRIINCTHGPFSIGRDYLRRVCFGLATPDEDIVLIKKILKDCDYNNVQFCKAIRNDQADFGIIIQSLDS